MLRYAASLVRATRPDAEHAPELIKRYVRWGAGPRASQTLLNGDDKDVPQPFSPDLLERVPGNSWFASSFGGLDANIKQAADEALKSNPGAQKQVSQVEAVLGVKLDDLYALLSGDQALFAGPGAPLSAARARGRPPSPSSSCPSAR